MVEQVDKMCSVVGFLAMRVKAGDEVKSIKLESLPVVVELNKLQRKLMVRSYNYLARELLLRFDCFWVRAGCFRAARCDALNKG